MSEEILKACPHCGSEGVLYEEDKGCFVLCQNTNMPECDIGNTHGNWTRQAAIRIWNRRAGDREPDTDKTPEAKHVGISELLDAAVRRMTDPILRLMQNDPHQWSTRPCQTCASITQITGKPFGCDYYRQTNSRRI